MQETDEEAALLGRIAVRYGFITMDQLAEATRERGRCGKKIGAIMLERGMLDELALGKVLALQRRHRDALDHKGEPKGEEAPRATARRRIPTPKDWSFEAPRETRSPASLPRRERRTGDVVRDRIGSESPRLGGAAARHRPLEAPRRDRNTQPDAAARIPPGPEPRELDLELDAEVDADRPLSFHEASPRPTPPPKPAPQKPAPLEPAPLEPVPRKAEPLGAGPSPATPPKSTPDRGDSRPRHDSPRRQAATRPAKVGAEHDQPSAPTRPGRAISVESTERPKTRTKPAIPRFLLEGDAAIPATEAAPPEVTAPTSDSGVLGAADADGEALASTPVRPSAEATSAPLARREPAPVEPAHDAPPPRGDAPRDDSSAALEARRAAPATGPGQAEQVGAIEPLPWEPLNVESPRVAYLHELLAHAVTSRASDVHIHADTVGRMRHLGKLEPITDKPLAAHATEEALTAILTPWQRRRLDDDGEIDLAYAVEGVGRFRVNVYRQQNGTNGVFHVIPAAVPTLKSLGLPEALAKLTNYTQGIVLLTGPAGSGKTSTLAALVNIINEERADHILTIEDPIEYVFPSKRCIVNQRQVGRHTESFASGLRGALREDPDIICIGELRDLETISLALTAAETGHLVLATLHTGSAVGTINRIVGAYPPGQQPQVRSMMSESLRAVISQRLLAGVDGHAVVALEALFVTRAVGALIRDNRTFQIGSVMQTGRAQGMRQLDDSLRELLEAGRIHEDDALANCNDPRRLGGH